MTKRWNVQNHYSNWFYKIFCLNTVQLKSVFTIYYVFLSNTFLYCTHVVSSIYFSTTQKIHKSIIYSALATETVTTLNLKNNINTNTNTFCQYSAQLLTLIDFPLTEPIGSQDDFKRVVFSWCVIWNCSTEFVTWSWFHEQIFPWCSYH